MLKQDILSVTSPEENNSNYQYLLNRIIEMTEKITTSDGYTETIIPYLYICRHSSETPVVPGILTPSFCLILRGGKDIHLGKHIIHAHPGDYLASIIDMPASAQVVGASMESPYIGVRIDLTSTDIASVMIDAEISYDTNNKKIDPGAFIGQTNKEFLELFIRLLKLIDKPAEAKFLSSLIKREMIFQLLSGEYKHLFLQQAFYDHQADGTYKAIAWIKENYTHPFTVEELAKSFNMSASGLQHKFKAITTMSPVQYQKQLRLQEARRLMLSGGVDVTTAALTVGYESPSQFSREYRRIFGLPPLQDIKSVKINYPEVELENFLKLINRTSSALQYDIE